MCENSLFKVAKGWDLGNYILMSNGEEITGGRTRISILSDCVEAIIAAIYLDKGINTSKNFILKNFSRIIESAMKDQIILDYKTKLQEVLQKKGEVDIQYNLIKFEGPPHRRKFYISVIYHGETHGTGSGYSKKEAEQDAAQTSLMKMDDIYE